MATQKNKSITTTLYLKTLARTVLALIPLSLVQLASLAQQESRLVGRDTVIVNFGDSSRLVFEIQNDKDLQTLKNYDLNIIVNDIEKQLKNDSTKHDELSQTNYIKDSLPTANPTNPVVVETEDSLVDEQNSDDTDKGKKKDEGPTSHFFNIDVGTNNYLTNGKFPDENNELYAVRPWGSWYISLNSVNRTKVAGKLHLDWGGGLNWYNFKFQNDQTRIEKTDQGLTFFEDTNDVSFIKSKLTASYINATLVPMLIFSSQKGQGEGYDNKNYESFRIGLGGYAGYRLGSHTKYVYKDDGNKERDKDSDNFHLNNWRYGLRLQMGYKGMDVFANYDISPLFNEAKGPELNAFSFGITF